MNKKESFYLGLKRFLDIFFSLFLIIILFTPLLFICFITFICVGGSPIYTQVRLGKDKKEFKMYKFHSYKIGAPEIPPYKIKNHELDPYFYKWGHFLKATSIDELPQLFNILKGDMSFIGPRPGAKENEDELIIERDKQDPSPYLVKPGLTGLAQVELHRNSDPSKKAKYDAEYVKNITFALDLKIFIKTFTVLF